MDRKNVYKMKKNRDFAGKDFINFVKILLANRRKDGIMILVISILSLTVPF